MQFLSKLHVAQAPSEIAQVISSCGVCQPIRSKYTPVASVHILATPPLHYLQLKMLLHEAHVVYC